MRNPRFRQATGPPRDDSRAPPHPPPSNAPSLLVLHRSHVRSASGIGVRRGRAGNRAISSRDQKNRPHSPLLIVHLL